MKKVIVLAAMMAVASAAYGSEDKIAVGGGADAVGTLDCTGATELTCGDTAANPDEGPGGTVDIYGCSSLSYGECGEVVYEICTGGDGDLVVDVNYIHTADNDLDVFLLGSCDPADCLDASTGVSGAEQVSANVPAGTYYVVVDGWAGNCDGLNSHDISVTCAQPCATAVAPASWGAIKALHQ